VASSPKTEEEEEEEEKGKKTQYSQPPHSKTTI
jgi:hypothetical protein